MLGPFESGFRDLEVAKIEKMMFLVGSLWEPSSLFAGPRSIRAQSVVETNSTVIWMAANRISRWHLRKSANIKYGIERASGGKREKESQFFYLSIGKSPWLPVGADEATAELAADVAMSSSITSTCREVEAVCARASRRA